MAKFLRLHGKYSPYLFRQMLDSLGEQVEKGLKLNEEGIKFKTKTVQNGTVTYIQMTPEILLSSINKDNGKQVADLPERIPEETPRNEPEASHEKCLE